MEIDVRLQRKSMPDTAKCLIVIELLLKMRVLYSLPPQTSECLEADAMIWASELTAAGVPAEHWTAMLALARRARSYTAKAYPVSVDQVIHCYEETAAGRVWDSRFETWVAKNTSTVPDWKLDVMRDRGLKL